MAKTSITIKLAGDSGDGIQLSGHRLAMIQALFGHDVVTFADYPAEIRAPKGTLYGVSAYQIQMGAGAVFTPGDALDILVALSPAAYEVWLHKLKDGGILLIDEDQFTSAQRDQLGIDAASFQAAHQRYRMIKLPMRTVLERLFKEQNLKKKIILQSKNFFALGVLCWLLEKDIAGTMAWIHSNAKLSPLFKRINAQALTEGYTASLVRELIPFHVTVAGRGADAQQRYRFISGTSALALGFIAAARLCQRTLFYASYPITPASPLLHDLAAYHEPDIATFQAEDEMAAIGAAIGAAYGGQLGVVGTSGPGMSLMSEFIGLAVMAELPLVVVDVQRAGPSTGMPTKTSQGDLNLALAGRNDSAPVVVLAAHSPSDGFAKAHLAVKVALERNCVVVVLADAYLAGSHEIWPIPEPGELAPIVMPSLPPPDNFEPYRPHPQHLSVPWVPCGTKGYAHTRGGLEKTPAGDISYDGTNHEAMILRRHHKVLYVADLLPPLITGGDPEAPHVIVSWGSTLGAIRQFVMAHRLACQPHQRLAYIHLESLWPLQARLKELVMGHDVVMVLENNLGQATAHLRALLPDVTFVPVLKNDGKPWSGQDLTDRISPLLASAHTTGVS